MALAALVLLAPASAAPHPTPKTNLADVSSEVMCVVCGVPLDQATESPQAQREIAYIRTLINRGLTKEEIEDRLVAQYGQNVLAEPETSGFDLTAWLVPGIAIAIAAIAIAVGLWRWRRRGPGEPPTPAKPLGPSESERLDADLARYDL